MLRQKAGSSQNNGTSPFIVCRVRESFGLNLPAYQGVSQPRRQGLAWDSKGRNCKCRSSWLAFMAGKLSHRRALQSSSVIHHKVWVS